MRENIPLVDHRKVAADMAVPHREQKCFYSKDPGRDKLPVPSMRQGSIS